MVQTYNASAKISSIRHLRLEASSNCQLKCPSCPTASGEIQKSIGGGFLSVENFKKIVDDNPQIKSIELSNWGEIFLNPNILDIMKYAHEREVTLTVTNGANLNTVKEDVLEGIVKYGIRHITCSIDGASQETYSIYRRNGDFNRVIENIKQIVAYKRQYNSEFPRLRWQFVVFGHNEHEIETARQMVKDLGMDHFMPKLSWDEKFSPIQDQEAVYKAIGFDISEQNDFWIKNICTQLWTIPQVNWDGRVLGCCVNHWDDFGNAFEAGLETIVEGEKMDFARQMLSGKAAARDDIPCTRCWHYKSIKDQQNWITDEDVTKHRQQAGRNEYDL
ncbi:MAG: radical SAM protein [Cyanobacteria bacterium J06555_13]